MRPAMQYAQFSAAAAQRVIWRHPEWWSVGLSLGAWITLVSTPRHSPSHHSMAAKLMWWLVMVVAMMFPLVTAQVRQTAFGSLWTRRHRSISLFLTGYTVPWLLGGALVVVIQGQLPINARASAIIPVLLAAAWQFSPLKFRGLRNCHRVIPLAPCGWRANWSCLKFGWRIGSACLCACWALMMACAFTDHSLLTLCVATLVASRDRIGLE